VKYLKRKATRELIKRHPLATFFALSYIWVTQENGYIESFNDKLRDECLNREIFRNGKKAQTIA